MKSFDELVRILEEMLGPGVWWTGPGLVDVSDDEAQRFAAERARNIAQALVGRFDLSAKNPFVTGEQGIYCRVCGDEQYGPWGLYPLQGWAGRLEWIGRVPTDEVLMCETCGESTPSQIEAMREETKR